MENAHDEFAIEEVDAVETARLVHILRWRARMTYIVILNHTDTHRHTPTLSTHTKHTHKAHTHTHTHTH